MTKGQLHVRLMKLRSTRDCSLCHTAIDTNSRGIYAWKDGGQHFYWHLQCWVDYQHRYLDTREGEKPQDVDIKYLPQPRKKTDLSSLTLEERRERYDIAKQAAFYKFKNKNNPSTTSKEKGEYWQSKLQKFDTEHGLLDQVVWRKVK